MTSTTADLKCVVLYFDGACRPNPGRGGCGAVLKEPDWSDRPGRVIHGQEICKLSVPLGDTTSNAAEYCGLIGGLRKARRLTLPPRLIHIVIVGDSKLVVDQMMGENAVRNLDLQMYHATAVGLLCGFGAYTIKHLPREENAAADALANAALDENPEGHHAIYYPNLCGLSRAILPQSWGGGETRASNDMVTSATDGLHLIDAKFLSTIHPHSLGVLRGLRWGDKTHSRFESDLLVERFQR